MKNLPALALIVFLFNYLDVINGQSHPSSPPIQDRDAKTYDPKAFDGFTVVEKMPVFPGCESAEDIYECTTDKMQVFIQNQVRPPIGFTPGTIQIRFIVSRDGDVIDVSWIKDLGEGCCSEAMHQEAIRVVTSMNDMPVKWFPALQNGKPVPVVMGAYVRFK